MAAAADPSMPPRPPSAPHSSGPTPTPRSPPPAAAATTSADDATAAAAAADTARTSPSPPTPSPPRPPSPPPGLPTGLPDADARYRVWRGQHAPLLYDAFSSRKLLWPSQVVQWGQPTASSLRGGATAGDGDGDGGRGGGAYTTRQLFLSERTGNHRDPNTLLTYHIRVPALHTTRPGDVTRGWVETATAAPRRGGATGGGGGGIAAGGGGAGGDGAAAAAGGGTLLGNAAVGGASITNGVAGAAGAAPAGATSGGGTPSGDFPLVKRLIHPGEVNKIREVRPQVLVTHTDAPELFVWALRSQPHRRERDGGAPSVPDVTLAGHSANAEYALKVRRADVAAGGEVLVASGGADAAVLLWDLRDADGATPSSTGGGGGGALDGGASHGATAAAAASRRSLRPRTRFEGHASNVEDVAFSPLDPFLLASVADDTSLRVWDRRCPPGSVAVVRGAHTGDTYSVDWSRRGLLLTGGMDGLVKMWDPRKLVAAAASGGGGVVSGAAALTGAAAPGSADGSPPKGAPSTAAPAPVMTFAEHTAEVNSAVWHDGHPLVFASSSADSQVILWDVSKVSSAPTPPPAPGVSTGTPSPAVIFRHVGHRSAVVDFQWLPDPADPWTVASVSEDHEGSTLQVWRVCDLVMNDPAVAAAEMLEAETTRSGVRGRAAAAAAAAAIAATAASGR